MDSRDYITYEEINNIILHYLWESGFWNVASHFGNVVPLGLGSSRIHYNLIPQRTLTDLIQLGLMHIQMLANNSAGASDDNFCFLPTVDLIMKTPSELQEIVKDKIRNKNMAVGTKRKGGGSCNVKDITARKDDEKPDKDKEDKDLLDKIAKHARTSRLEVSGPSVGGR